MKYFILIILGFSILCFSYQENKAFKEGVFEMYENDVYLGKFYRKGNFQLEKYSNGDELIAKIDFKTDSTLLMSGIEKEPKDVDKIIWLIKYEEIKTGEYKIVSTPYNVAIDYKSEMIVKKISNSIEKKYLKVLDSLNK